MFLESWDGADEPHGVRLQPSTRLPPNAPPARATSMPSSSPSGWSPPTAALSPSSCSTPPASRSPWRRCVGDVENNERDRNEELLVELAAPPSDPCRSPQPRGPPACIWRANDYAGPCARVREPGRRPARHCSKLLFLRKLCIGPSLAVEMHARDASMMGQGAEEARVGGAVEKGEDAQGGRC
jgi:hypothetical protein